MLAAATLPGRSRSTLVVGGIEPERTEGVRVGLTATVGTALVGPVEEACS